MDSIAVDPALRIAEALVAAQRFAAALHALRNVTVPAVPDGTYTARVLECHAAATIGLGLARTAA